MTINSWIQKLATRYGGFPRNYIVVDTETTGSSIAEDLIVNIGHVIVEDGVVTSRLDAFLDWAGHGLTDPNWLYGRMEYCRSHMAAKNRNYRMSTGLLAERGGHPVEVLQEYRELFKAQKKAGYAFVMHNGYNFDAPRLCAHFARWTDEPFEFGLNDIWDTGMIEKASQLNMPPDSTDSMKSWSKRVGSVRAKGVFWALENHVIPKYDMVKRFGINPAEAHGAGFDAYVTHLLFEEFFRLSKIEPPFSEAR